MAPELRYWPRGGFLQATSSTSAPLRSAQALERYGIKLLIHAQVGPGKRGAPIPGQAAMRAWSKVSLPLAIILSPLLAFMWAVMPVTGQNRQRRQAGPAHRQTGSELRQWLIRGVCLAIPGTAVAAWYVIWAIHLPPHGPAGRWVALLLAGVFGIQNLITLYFVVLSFAMDGSNQAREPVTRPIRYLATNTVAVIALYCVVNAPLAICVAAVSALT